jgi:hypothetical protein
MCHGVNTRVEVARIDSHRLLAHSTFRISEAVPADKAVVVTLLSDFRNQGIADREEPRAYRLRYKRPCSIQFATSES